MNTSWENPSGHRAISYEENLSFILSDFYQENLSFLCGKSFANSLLFFRYFPPLFYHSSVHILFCSVQDSFIVRKKWWRSCCLSIKLLYGKIQLQSVILKYFFPYPERILVWLYSEGHCEQNDIVCRLWTRLVLFENVDGSLFVSWAWTGYGRERECRAFFWNEREQEMW